MKIIDHVLGLTIDCNWAVDGIASAHGRDASRFWHRSPKVVVRCSAVYALLMRLVANSLNSIPWWLHTQPQDNGATTIKDYNFTVTFYLTIANDPSDDLDDHETLMRSVLWVYASRWYDNSYRLFKLTHNDDQSEQSIAKFDDSSDKLVCRIKDEADPPTETAQAIVDRLALLSASPWPPHVAPQAKAALAEMISCWSDDPREKIATRLPSNPFRLGITQHVFTCSKTFHAPFML